MRHALLIPVVALALTGCQTTTALNGTAITYAMPRTDAKAVITSELKKCGADPDIETKVDLVAVPGVDRRPERYFTLSGDALASHHIKRGVAVSIAENGVIAGLNSDVEDRTAQIIGNFLKLAKSVIPIVGGGPLNVKDTEGKPSKCSLSAQQARDRVDAIEGQVNDLRGKLTSQLSLEEYRRIQRQIALLLTESEAIRSKTLTIQQEVDLVIDPSATVTGEINYSRYAKWFADSVTETDIKKSAPVTWNIAVLGNDAPDASRPGLRPCGYGIPVPAPRLFWL